MDRERLPQRFPYDVTSPMPTQQLDPVSAKEHDSAEPAPTSQRDAAGDSNKPGSTTGIAQSAPAGGVQRGLCNFNDIHMRQLHAQETWCEGWQPVTRSAAERTPDALSEARQLLDTIPEARDHTVTERTLDKIVEYLELHNAKE